MSLQKSRLYGILDLAYVSPKDAEQVCQQLLEGGVDLLQLRAKDKDEQQIMQLGNMLHQLTAPKRIPLIINDHPEIAKALDAEGVHVGQEDISVAQAKKIVGPNVLVGKSTHSREQARAAVDEGADYIGFGPLFATPTKPDYAPIGLEEIASVHREITVPIFCIGGIKKENLHQVLEAGATRVVIVSGILHADSPLDYTKTCKSMLQKQI